MPEELTNEQYLAQTSTVTVDMRRVPQLYGKPSLMDSLGYLDSQIFVERRFGQKLFDNQIDIVRALTDNTVRKLLILEARQSGKSTSAACGYSEIFETDGAVWNRRHPEPFRIGVFGPKASQAELILARMSSWARSHPKGAQMYNWEKCRNDRLTHINGSEIHAISASEQASNEGYSFNIIHLTEAQKISDYAVSNVILPMGGALGAKIVKEGTIRPIRNHFWSSWHEDPNFIKISHHWTYPSALYQDELVEYNGKVFPKYVLDMMPLQVKEQYVKKGIFPATSKFLYKGQMLLEDFLTQYEMRWLEAFGLFLTAEEKANLFSGTHQFQSNYANLAGEIYGGVDFATGTGEDETSVTVVEKVGNLKKKIFGVTWGNLPLPDQKRELLNLFGRSGKFPSCRLILGDMGGDGLAVIQDLQAEHSVSNIQAVNFGATDKDVREASMNLKTSMYMDFKKDCQLDQFQYPSTGGDINNDFYMEILKGVRQWSALEQELREGTVNRKIQGPESDHDDVCSSDILANRACKLGGILLQRGSQSGRLMVLPHYFVANPYYR